jgi:ABC-2 type transport system permease protein
VKPWEANHMSTVTEPTPPPTAAAPAEVSPSATLPDTPAVARAVGFIGLFALVVGLVAIITNRVLTPRWIGTTGGYLFCAVGLALMLYHAVRDTEQEVRRMYGGFGLLCVLLGIAAALIPGPVFGVEAEAAAREGTKAVGYNLLPWGVGAGLVGLLFLFPYTRHETDRFYRGLATNTLLGLGALLCVGSVIGGLARPEFLAGPGLALALLGLGFLCAYLGQVDTSDGPGYSVAFALGVVGAAVAVYAIARSAVPTMLYEGPTALRRADNSLDAWRVTARVLVGLAFAALAGYGAVGRNLPLWLRSTFVALGVAGVGVLIYSSTTKAPMASVPGPYLVPGGVLLAGVGLVYLAVALGVCSDNPFITLTRRELSSYFMSPIGYLVLGGMAACQWIGYWEFVGQLDRAARGSSVPEPIVRYYMFSLFPVLALTLEIPALTMRLLAEERRTGSLEVLLTAPVSEWSVVLSKFLATLVFFVISWVPAALYLVALRVEGAQPFDYRPLLSFYVALVATGAGFVGMGMFFSALTRNQIVAAVLTFVGMLTFLLFLFVGESLGVGQTARVFLGKLSYLSLWRESLGGQLPLRDVLLWVSMAVFWIFLTLKVLEMRKWS